MKTYNNLYNTFLSNNNIKLAINNATKGKRKRKRVALIYNNPDKYVPIIREYAKNYKAKYHNPKQIYDGIIRKVRTIIVPNIYEQILHHMIVQTLLPMFTKGMYEHSYGSIPGRGGYHGMKRIKIWIKRGGKNIKYCLKMDIKKYFDSIPHEILKSKLSKKIKDEEFLKIIFEVIDTTESGIPLGFYTSQWLANWYLQDLDHYIKEQLGAVYYIRYMDDMVIFGSNKKKLHKMRLAIEKYLNSLGLTLKDNWQVFRFENNGKYRDLDFMGFRFYRNKIILRRSILLRATRKAKRISKKEKITVYDCKQMLSYLGWIKATDVYSIYEKRIKPYVDFQYCKRRVSKDARRKNKWHGISQVMVIT